MPVHIVKTNQVDILSLTKSLLIKRLALLPVDSNQVFFIELFARTEYLQKLNTISINKSVFVLILMHDAGLLRQCFKYLLI